MGIFKWLSGQKNEKVEPAPQPKPAPKPQPKPEPKPVPKPVKKMRGVPQRAGEAPLQYQYRLRLTPESGIDVASAILKGEERIVQVGYDEDDKAVLLAEDDKIFGRIRDEKKMEMVRDFMKRGDPVGAVLREDAATVDLLFFRDRRKGQEWREQTVVKLTGCKSKACQEWITLLTPGDEVEVEEDDEHEGRVNVSQCGNLIGRLPAAAAKRWLEEEGVLTVVESVDMDDNADYYPSIRIYW